MNSSYESSSSSILPKSSEFISVPNLPNVTEEYFKVGGGKHGLIPNVGCIAFKFAYRLCSQFSNVVVSSSHLRRIMIVDREMD